MDRQIFTVKDLALQAYGQPIFVRARGEALRSFQDEVNNKNNQSAIAAHPEDYELYHLGVYNDEDASFTMKEKPELVARAVDLIRE